jgi:hypothetical protein
LRHQKSQLTFAFDLLAKQGFRYLDTLDAFKQIAGALP